MSAVQQRERTERFYTAEDLERLPSEARYELIRGELCPASLDKGAQHGSITASFSARVSVFVEDNELGVCFAAGTLFVIEQNPDTVLAPDFAFVAAGRIPDALPNGYLRFAPDIVLETRSPSDTKREVGLKVARWLQAGTRIVWVIDPDAQTLTTHCSGQEPRILRAGDTLDGKEVLPGFALPLTRLFRSTSLPESAIPTEPTTPITPPMPTEGN